MKDRHWYVYMLRCSDGSFYTGITKNVTKKMKKHNKRSEAKYT
ncbi:MAG: GIY-YIG nuclease family protein, partial [Candidatus Zixiibacteriota bacterium]